MVTVLCLIALAAIHSWSLVQLDVNNAFLHDSLDEEIYMKLPYGFTSKGENHVYKLNKSLYSLKRASWQWFSKLFASLLDHGFSQSKNDYSLFKWTQDSSFIALLVYVDDIIVVSNDDTVVSDLKFFLHSRFKLKDLCPLKYFLGLEVVHSTKGISICQRKFALNIPSDTNFLRAKPTTFPMEQNLHLSKAYGELLYDPSVYCWFIGRLLHLTLTRLDLTYIVHTLSQFLNQPCDSFMCSSSPFKIYKRIS